MTTTLVVTTPATIQAVATAMITTLAVNDKPAPAPVAAPLLAAVPCVVATAPSALMLYYG